MNNNTHSLQPAYSLYELIIYALKIGATGFGGPIALVGYMFTDLVEKRKWINEDDFREGLALAELAPGPLAAQLAIYLGYVHYKIRGATVVGIAFVLPSFLMVLGLGWLYQLYGGIEWIQALSYGIGACVIGIIAFSAYKLTIKSVGTDWLLWCIYVITAAITIITESEEVLVFIGAGIASWLIKAPPKIRQSKTLLGIYFIPLAGFFPAGKLEANILQTIFAFFFKAGAFVFGSGLAIVPFLYSGVVKEHHWLNERQFIDAVAVAMITPGPVVITVGFIGYLIAGLPGAVTAAVATFLPCYLFTIIPAPYFKKYGHLPGIKAFVDGVTAAAIGTIAGAVVILGRRTLHDIPTVTLAMLTILLLWKTEKIKEPWIVFGAGLIGLTLKYFW